MDLHCPNKASEMYHYFYRSYFLLTMKFTYFRLFRHRTGQKSWYLDYLYFTGRSSNIVFLSHVSIWEFIVYRIESKSFFKLFIRTTESMIGLWCQITVRSPFSAKKRWFPLNTKMYQWRGKELPPRYPERIHSLSLCFTQFLTYNSSILT